MNRTAVGLAASVATLVALTACASPTNSEARPPTPTPTVNEAAASCKSFSALTDELATLVVNIWTKKDQPADADRLNAMPDDFDMVALKAEGSIGERMGAVADLLQDTSPIVMSTKPDDYFAAIKAVQRACAAANVTIGVGTWK